MLASLPNPPGHVCALSRCRVSSNKLRLVGWRHRGIGSRVVAARVAELQKDADEQKGAEVTVDSESHEQYTIVQITGPNVPGLLTLISGVFSDLKVDVKKANVSTEGGALSDRFYVTDLTD